MRVWIVGQKIGLQCDALSPYDRLHWPDACASHSRCTQLLPLSRDIHRMYQVSAADIPFTSYVGADVLPLRLVPRWRDKDKTSSRGYCGGALEEPPDGSANCSHRLPKRSLQDGAAGFSYLRQRRRSSQAGHSRTTTASSFLCRYLCGACRYGWPDIVRQEPGDVRAAVMECPQGWGKELH
ncbi:hypothetical protein J3A64_003697 [Pseudarthrobacter sp. PvP004]|nr:hypothetical protein [Pseudarthrobacter sp. PvP004]